MGSPRFILGRAGSGKTHAILQEIAAQLAADPLGPPIFVLVPDQATLLYEQQIAAASPTRGYLRVCVITFRQLVELLLREGGGAAIPEVTPLGRRILIGRLLRRLGPELTFYRSTARQPGLPSRLDEAFAEFEHSGGSTDDLETLAAVIETDQPRSALPAKLRDIRLLYRAYETLLGSERLDQHRRVKAALAAARQSTTLPTALVFVDAFYEFTHTERALLCAVASAGAEVTVALTLDPADATGRRLDEPVPLEHPFRLTRSAYRRLHRQFRDAGHLAQLDIRVPLLRYAKPDLRNIDAQFSKLTRISPATPEGGVRLIEAPTRRAEVDAAARQILDWIGTGVRLRDILVLTRDVDSYFRHIDASFREHGIGYFVDRQRPAMHDPLIRTVRAIASVALNDFPADGVIELLNAGLCGPGGDACDAVTNYLLAHRIRGLAAWEDAWTYTPRRRQTRDEDDELANERDDFERADLTRINDIRTLLVNGLRPLLMDSQRLTANDWCRRLCESLDRLGVRDTLAARIALAEDVGDLVGAATHREVWTEFVALLDQISTVLDDEDVLTFREFVEVVDVALERFVLAITPPTIDQVLVGGIDRTRSGPVKACIVLGLSEGIFPNRHESDGALSDDDRRVLESRSIELRPGTRTRQFDEQFLAYLAFSRASHWLTVTRPTHEDDGRDLSPSTFWTQLRSLFRGGLPIETVRCAPTPRCIATARQLVEASIEWAAIGDGLPLASRQLVTWMHRSADPAIARLREAVVQAIEYRNEARLDGRLAEQLYAVPMRASATRLETFAACPFRQFAQHALRLEPRQRDVVTAIDLGIAYHRVLESLVRGVIAERRDAAQPIADLADRIDAFSRIAAQEVRNEMLLQPGRNAFLLDGVRRTLTDVVETQRRQLALGQFRPQHAEFSFGLDDPKSAPPLTIVTPKGRTVELRGRIDRVDTIRLGDRLAATVIDYKLGGRKPEFDRIYFGLSLQLVTYLLVLSALGEQITAGMPVEPAAALFVKLARSVETVDHPDDAPDPSSDDFFLTSGNKARGVISDAFAAALDGTLEPKETSAGYAIKQTVEPIALKNKDVLAPEAFARLIEWTRAKIGQLADEMMDGEIGVHPYRLKTLTPCSTCDFRSVCRLDLAFNRYQEILPKGDERLADIVGGEAR